MKYLLIILLLPLLVQGQVFVSYSATSCEASGKPCPGLDSVLYDSIYYHTVLIGDRCWFKESLNVGIRIAGGDNQTDNTSIEKYCYNDVSDSCNVYGGLYQWNEAMQYVTTESAQGICPSGWHIPSWNEWQTAMACVDINESVVGSAAGGKMKETGLAHWTTPNTGATNSTGFTGRAGGYYSVGFNYNKEKLAMWSSTEQSTSASLIVFNYNNALFDEGIWLKTIAMAIRCIKDL